MGRQKVYKAPKPAKQYNLCGVEYPLNEGFMGSLSYRLSELALREYQNDDTFKLFTNEEVLAYFVNPEDRDMCRIAPRFLRISEAPVSFGWVANRYVHAPQTAVPYESAEVTQGVEVQHQRVPFSMNNVNHKKPVPTLLLPKYVADGPRGWEGDKFARMMWAAYDRNVEIASEFSRINMLVSTLNDICHSVGDILANFPALEVLMRDQSAMSNASPVMRPTKMPIPLREAWRLATRTITRVGLMDLSAREMNFTDMWVLRFSVEIQQPEWMRSSPGYRHIVSY